MQYAQQGTAQLLQNRKEIAMINQQTQAVFKVGGLFVVLLAAIAAVLIASSASAQTTDARVRVLHASPDAPAVDVYVDGSEAISDLSFNEITDYVSLPSGTHGVQVFPTSANGTGTPVIDVPSLNLEAGKDYTVAAVGLLAAIEPLVLEDKNAAPAAGKAHIRVVHASPDAPNVDIFAEGAGVVISDLAFKQASTYLPLNAGSYNLEVRPTGTTTVALDLNGVQLEAGKVYTAFAVGLAAGQPALTVNLTTDAVAQAATGSPTPAATPAPTSAALPDSGGPPAGDSGVNSLWVIAAGLALMAISVTGVSLAAVRVRGRN
jgi:hypothetical protein